MIRPLIGNTYDSISQVEQEINFVMKDVCDFALQLLPLHRKKNVPKKQFRDAKLQRLCENSKLVWSEGMNAGCPMTGEVYSRKNSLKRAVRQWINTLKPIEERKRIQHPKHFTKIKPLPSA